MTGSDPGHAVTVATDGGAMPAVRWLPESGRGPGLLLLQEIFGLTRYLRRRGADLAAAGYVVLAPELYWRQDAAPIDESAPDALATAMGRLQQLDWAVTVGDAVAALHHLRASAEVAGGCGAVGFCFGGGVAFNVAAVDAPDVLVSYYGSAIPGLLELAPQVTAPSLHHFGTADDYIDAATVEKIRQAVTTPGGAVEFETYPGANHAFDNPDFMLYHPDASALAWRRTLDILARELPTA